MFALKYRRQIIYGKYRESIGEIIRTLCERKEVETKLNRYHEIKVDQTIIHIPKAYGYSQLTVVLTWNKFKVLTPHGELLMNEDRPYVNKK